MPRGDKSSYTDKQKRKAEHIEESYENRGVPEKGGRAPRLGDREQGRWGAATKADPDEARRTPTFREKGRQGGRRCRCLETRRGSFGIRQEGGCDPKEECRQIVLSAYPASSQPCAICVARDMRSR